MFADHNSVCGADGFWGRIGHLVDDRDEMEERPGPQHAAFAQPAAPEHRQADERQLRGDCEANAGQMQGNCKHLTVPAVGLDST